MSERDGSPWKWKDNGAMTVGRLRELLSEFHESELVAIDGSSFGGLMVDRVTDPVLGSRVLIRKAS